MAIRMVTLLVGLVLGALFVGVAGEVTAQDCHPSYEGQCLDPGALDYDCAGGDGDGPLYSGPVTVVGEDVFGLDGDGNGLGCENSPAQTGGDEPAPETRQTSLALLRLRRRGSGLLADQQAL